MEIAVQSLKWFLIVGAFFIRLDTSQKESVGKEGGVSLLPKDIILSKEVPVE